MTITSTDTNSSPVVEEEKKTTTTQLETYDVVIVGGGVAGLTSALYASRDGYKTLVLEGTYASSVDYPGGALMLTPDIENFPGYTGETGEELIGLIRAQAEKFGTNFEGKRAEKIVHGKTSHTIHTNEGDLIITKTIILAMGATARTLGLEGEVELYGAGVSTCATCDGAFFAEKSVAVVGGGDTAVEDALFLTRYADKVNLIVRKDSLKASGPQAREILTHPKVQILWNSEVVSIKGVEAGYVQGVTLCSDGNLYDLDVTGLFVAIGRDPATGFLKESGIKLDNENYVKVDGDSTRTNVAGIFAAGDVVDKIYRQAITSAGKGAQAALEARHHIMGAVTH